MAQSLHKNRKRAGLGRGKVVAEPGESGERRKRLRFGRGDIRRNRKRLDRGRLAAYKARQAARHVLDGKCKILSDKLVVRGGALGKHFKGDQKYGHGGRTAALPLTEGPEGKRFLLIDRRSNDLCRLLTGLPKSKRPLDSLPLFMTWRQDLQKKRQDFGPLRCLELPVKPGASETRPITSTDALQLTMEATVDNLNWLSEYIHDSNECPSHEQRTPARGTGDEVIVAEDACAGRNSMPAPRREFRDIRSFMKKFPREVRLRPVVEPPAKRQLSLFDVFH